MLSFVELPSSLLQIPGAKFILNEKFCQDPLEAYFGKQRSQEGANSNPSVRQFHHNATSIRLQGSAALDPVRGTTKRQRKPLSDITSGTPMPKRKKQKGRRKLATEYV